MIYLSDLVLSAARYEISRSDSYQDKSDQVSVLSETYDL